MEKVERERQVILKCLTKHPEYMVLFEEMTKIEKEEITLFRRLIES